MIRCFAKECPSTVINPHITEITKRVLETCDVNDIRYFLKRDDLNFNEVNLKVEKLKRENNAHVTILARSHHIFNVHIQHDIFNMVLKYGEYMDVEYIFESDEFKEHNTQEIFENGLQSKDIQTVERVLSHSDDEIYDQEFLEHIHKSPYILRMLARDMRIYPSECEHALFMYSVKLGDLETIKYLIEESGIDPSAENNRAIILAAKRNDNIKYNVANYLLKKPNVDPSVNDFEAIFTAINMRYYKTLKVLLQHNITIRDLNPRRLRCFASNCKVIKEWLYLHDKSDEENNDIESSDSIIKGKHVSYRIVMSTNI